MPILGLVLAQISNYENKAEHAIIQNGVGEDEDNHKEWTEDIFRTYDFDDDGCIDKRELKKFVDQSFDKVLLTDNCTKKNLECPDINSNELRRMIYLEDDDPDDDDDDI